MCALTVLFLSLALAPVAEASALPGAPAGFLGTQSWIDPTPGDFALMRVGGVRMFRDNLSWSAVEPRPGARLWQRYDNIFAAAAASGIEIFPVLFGSPEFAADRAQHAPRPELWSRYASFVRDAVARYGRGGSFWLANPDLKARPPRAWQVWNEPNLGSSWDGRPNAKEYVELLKITRSAILSRDRRAKIVLAGLPSTTRRAQASPFLRSVYRRPGVKRLFDVVALHPYAYSARTVVTIMRSTRALMRRFSDGRTPIWVTEFGWGSQREPSLPDLVGTESDQAKRVTQLASALASHRVSLGIERAFWFCWQDRLPIPGEGDWWALHTGLLRLDGTTKPAFRAFKAFTARRPAKPHRRAHRR